MDFFCKKSTKFSIAFILSLKNSLTNKFEERDMDVFLASLVCIIVLRVDL